MAVACFECEKSAKWCCGKQCNKYWCEECVQWNLRLQPMCRDCDESVWEYIDDDEAMLDQSTTEQTADEIGAEEANTLALRVFFCDQCNGFAAADEEAEWPSCRRCGIKCFKCKVKVHCHLCNSWWDTPDKLISHLQLQHRAEMAKRSNNDQ